MNTPMSNLLLLSNSTLPGEPFFDWALPYLKDFMQGISGYVAFVPYAAVGFSYDAYEEKLRSGWKDLGLEIRSVHRADNQAQCIEDAAAIAVGGGNTFALLHQLYAEDLVQIIQSKVGSGTAYCGWSAGANLACPSIKTTNDMPIVQPASFEALGLIPFQINPHYTEAKLPGHGGEGRVERIKEFLVLHPEVPVLGLPEGMLVERRGNDLRLKGNAEAALFRNEEAVQYLAGGQALNFLL